MNKRTILCIVFFLMIFITPASAITVDTIDISWDTPRVLTVTGTVDSGEAGEKVTIEIVNPLKNAGDYVLGKQDKIFFNHFAQITSDEKGFFSYCYDIESSTTKNGNFTIRLRSSGEDAPPVEIPFPYYTRTNCDNIALELNALVGKTQKDDVAIDEITQHFDKWLKKVYFVSFPLYDELVEDGYQNEIAESVSYFPNFNSAEDAVDAIKSAVVIVAINHANPSAYEEYFVGYADELGIGVLDEYDIYCDYNSNQKEYFAKVFQKVNSKKTLKNCDYPSLFAQAIVLYDLSAANGSGAVKRVLTQHASYFDFSVYEKSGNDTTKVCTKISHAFENDKINSLEDVQNILDTFIEKETKTNTGGGGGSSTKKTSTISVPVVSSVTTPQKVPTDLPDNFVDLDDVQWAKEAIKNLANSGIVSGYGENTFGPHDYLTRAQFAKMICKLFYIEGDVNGSGFSDVNSDDWFAPYVYALKKAGIVNGVSEDRFGPNDNISRQDMLVLVARAAKLNNVEIIQKNDTIEFTDQDEIHDYARASVELFARAGIVSGHPDGSFDPDGLSTRAEAAKILYEIKKLYERRNGA